MNAEIIRDAIHLLEKAVRAIEAGERYQNDPKYSVEAAIRLLEGQL